MKKAIFLDRDGTLNEDNDYPHRIGHFRLLPGVIEGLKKLSSDFLFIIITNQSGIGRGIFKDEDFHVFNNHLVSELKKNGIEIKKTYYCPHHPDEKCKCRKPHITSILNAAEEYKIDVKSSWVIGDHPSDVKMGLDAGTRAVYMLTGHGKKHMEELKAKGLKPSFVAENFLEASRFILERI